MSTERVTPLASLVANSTFMSSYDDWVQHPVTQRMLAIVRMECGPRGLSLAQRGAENALYYAGGVDKVEDILRLLTGLREYAEELQKVRQMGAGLVPDYGAGKLLKSGEPV